MGIDTTIPVKLDDGSELPWTAPIDSRYPNTNVTRYCFQMFVDYQRCTRLFSKGDPKCEYFLKAYTSLCPHVWVAKWHDQLANGSFPVDLPPDKK